MSYLVWRNSQNAYYVECSSTDSHMPLSFFFWHTGAHTRISFFTFYKHVWIDAHKEYNDYEKKKTYILIKNHRLYTYAQQNATMCLELDLLVWRLTKTKFFLQVDSCFSYWWCYKKRQNWEMKIIFRLNVSENLLKSGHL